MDQVWLSKNTGIAAKMLMTNITAILAANFPLPGFLDLAAKVLNSFRIYDSGQAVITMRSFLCANQPGDSLTGLFPEDVSLIVGRLKGSGQAEDSLRIHTRQHIPTVF